MNCVLEVGDYDDRSRTFTTKEVYRGRVTPGGVEEYVRSETRSASGATDDDLLLPVAGRAAHSQS